MGWPAKAGAPMGDSEIAPPLWCLILEREIETTDFTEYTDKERVMDFMAFTSWGSLRFDR